MRVLVCGANGFVGHHLVESLHGENHAVVATGIDPEIADELAPFVDEYYGNCDLTKQASVAALPLSTVDAVINLAGLAQVGQSFGAEEKYLRVNVGVHTTLADELIEQELNKVRVVAVSTGAVYDSHQPMPLDEESALLREGSPYALSKIAMEAALDERRQKGLDIITVRPFNHIGPGQLPGFLVPDLVAQLQAGDEIVVGNLSTRRDYTDVRDVVRAYVLLATIDRLNHTVYNVCSGSSHSGDEILDALTTAFEKPNIKVVVDEARIRPNDPADIFGSHQKLTEDTGWEPSIGLDQTIGDIVRDVRD